MNNQDNDTNGSKVRNVDHLNRLQVLFVNRICNFHLQWNSVFFHVALRFSYTFCGENNWHDDL